MKTVDEYESKFDLPERFRLPAITDVGGRRVKTVTHNLHLESTYFDTGDDALLTRRVTVRRRTGDGDVGWQIKLPAGDMRTELHFPLGDDEAVPDEVASALAGVAAGELRMRAIIRTERRVVRLSDGDDQLAEIADDRVHVTTTGSSATIMTWRELEIEVPSQIAHRRRVMRGLTAHVRAAGARRAESSSKLARALGNDASVPAGPFADYVQEQADVLAAGDVELRTGPGRIHRTRVAVRRLRSVLRVFAADLPDDAAELERELSWYQQVLGAVRDCEVQRERVLRAVHGLDPALVLGPVAADLGSTLLADEATARAELASALSSSRYLWLQQQVTELVASRRDIDPEQIVQGAHRARRAAQKRLQAAAGTTDAATWHRARKAIKRARYATELAAPLLGRDAERRVKRYKAAQDLLGDQQDCVVTADLLRRRAAAVAERADSNGFTYGVLFDRNQGQAAELLRKARKLRV